MNEYLRDLLTLGGACLCFMLAIAALRLALYLFTASPADMAHADREMRSARKRRDLVRLLTHGTKP